jgi:hypothetical protein
VVISQENVELARAYWEDIARASREDFDTETTISRMAELWDPEIEWGTRGGPVVELADLYLGIEDGATAPASESVQVQFSSHAIIRWRAALNRYRLAASHTYRQGPRMAGGK